jgi:uncharacterized protein YegP (UPF0339 family)
MDNSKIVLKKLSKLKDADSKWSNAFKLESNGKIALKTNGYTQGTLQICVKPDTKLIESDSINFIFRSVVTGEIKPTGIKMTLKNNGINFYSEGVGEKINLNSEDYTKGIVLKILNIGNRIRVECNCEIIFEQETYTPCTEYFLIENNSLSSILFYGIDFDSFMK